MNNRRVQWWRRPENWAGFLISVSFHAACIALIQATWPTANSVAAMPAPTRYAYWSEQVSAPVANAWDSDPRAVRSPTLFALPSAAGFSPARNRSCETLPSLSVPGESNMLLERMRAQPDTLHLYSRTLSDIANIYRTRWLDVDEGEEPYSIPMDERSAVLVEWVDAAPDVFAGLPLALNPPPSGGERAWEVSASILFSDAGEVVSVLMVKSTADRERNESIARALSRLRAAPGREGRYNVNLYYYPAPLAERAGANAVSP